MNEKGFTLLELMITVAIIAILASIAYPSYQDSVRKTHRANAQAAVLEASSFMERYFTENNSYASAAIPVGITSDNYAVEFTAAPTATFYQVQARPTTAAQALDACGLMSLTSTNVKSALIGGCW